MRMLWKWMVLYGIYREDGGNGITFVHMLYILQANVWVSEFQCKTLDSLVNVGCMNKNDSAIANYDIVLIFACTISDHRGDSRCFIYV
jgi:hypothetical protein